MQSVWEQKPELVVELRRLWGDGHSCSKIAQALGNGITRCGVIGKARRLNLPARATTFTTTRISKKEVPRALQAVRPVPASAKLPTFPTEAPPILGEHGKFPDGSACRFIHGDPAGSDWQSCGQPVALSGTSWCLFHRGRVYQPQVTQLSRKKAEAEAAEYSAKSDAIARRAGLG